MAGQPQREPIEVTVEIDGRERVAGALWVHERRGQSATFTYVEDYLRDADAYDLDPALPRRSGPFQTSPGQAIFNCFSDIAPDRWGQNLLRRAERDRATAVSSVPRSLTPADFMLGSRDDLRQGAIRLRRPGTDTYWSTAPSAVPKLVALPDLLSATDRFADDRPTSRDLKDLIDAGGSLGGARPKAAVLTADGALAMAKFPRKGSDEWDVIGWEKLAADLATGAGLPTPPSELMTIDDRNVLITRRFDRDGDRRVGFASTLTLLGAADGDRRSYLEIAEALEVTGCRAGSDLPQLFRRIIFSILISNTDDHLRNHAVLWESSGWALSPAFDLNPNPEGAGLLSTAIDLDDPTASIELALSMCDYFRLTVDEAKQIIGEVELATRGWGRQAADLGLRGREIELMTQAFDTPERSVAQRLAASTDSTATRGGRHPAGTRAGGRFARGTRGDGVV